MGLSSSQARLLSITARLSSNEYESQQISNAKMRLATKSQEASEAYISALSDTQYSFVTFNTNGESSNTALTAALLYEYSDSKNQYILTNSAGKVLLCNKDLVNYQKASNLDEFLSLYGINKSYKTTALQDSHDKIFGTTGLIEYARKWDAAVGYKEDELPQSSWASEKISKQSDYLESLGKYLGLANQKALGEDVTNAQILEKQKEMENNKQKYIKFVSYYSARESLIVDKALEVVENPSEEHYYVKVGKKDDGTDLMMDARILYNGYQEYKSEMAKYQDELDKLGLSANNAFEYSDNNKAQWYTNLWYKINGPSTDKSGLDNYASFVANDGIREYYGGLQEENKIPNNDSKIVNSSVWISNALSKGLVSIEKATYTKSEMTLQDSQNPFKFNLNGISWDGQIYSSVPDIVESDNNKNIAKAEAEYQRQTAEINAKDEKYQRQLSLLDSEHNAIQTEYESVKTAMNKNIERSFKAFQG